MTVGISNLFNRWVVGSTLITLLVTHNTVPQAFDNHLLFWYLIPNSAQHPPPLSLMHALPTLI
jgi:hypothetical protein